MLLAAASKVILLSEVVLAPRAYGSTTLDFAHLRAEGYDRVLQASVMLPVRLQMAEVVVLQCVEGFA